MRGAKRSSRAALLASLIALGASAPAVRAEAQPKGAPAPAPSASSAPGAVTAPPEVLVEVVPVINTGGTPSAVAWGWNELLVRIQNTSSKPVRGVVKVETEQMPDRHRFTASAPYSVGAGAIASVRVPVQVLPFADVMVQINDDALGLISSQKLSSTAQSSVILFDVSDASRLRGAVHEAYISPMFMLPGASSHPTGSGMALLVGTPRIDPTTGDPVLPDRAPLYSTADAVLMRSDMLARITGPELEALAGYVLAGGTLALVMARPEDTRHSTLVALAGGEIAKGPVHPETRKLIALPAPSTFGSAGVGKVIAPAASPTDEVSEKLTGWTGGNLQGSAYGAAAAYGLGEVHVLAFDPTRRPGVDDDWVKARMVDLARRAYDRRSTLVHRPGGVSTGANLTRIRQRLDPNESSRWAIGAAAILLCMYAVLAGPINFSMAAKKGKPLRALRYLPLLAAATFALIVGIGVAAKGFTGRARHLTLIEAGAGMTKGTARRWRGFFTSSTKELTVRTTDSLSVLSTAILPDASDKKEHMLIDRDGARLTDLTALPWQTIVIREDGFASLGDGISIVKEGASDIALINRSGRGIRAALLWLPGSDVRYWSRIADGDKVVTSAGSAIATTTEGRHWYGMAFTTRRVGGLDVHELHASALREILEKDAPGLGDAWQAIEEASDPMADWFPGDMPVLLAQLDGGEGKMSDSGLRLESDRLLVRVVGFGGKP